MSVHLKHSVARGILFLSCSSVCASRNIVNTIFLKQTIRLYNRHLTRYPAEYLTHFHQSHVSDALWDRDEYVTFWGQKVKIQGHGGITYAGTVIAQAEAYSTQRLVSS